MNLLDELKSGKWIPYTVAVCTGVILYLFLTNLSIFTVFFDSIWTLTSPLIFGVLIAYLMDPLAKFFEKKGFKRKVSVVFALLIIVAAAILLLVMMVPQLIRGLAQFVENLSTYISALERQIVKMDAYMNKDGGDVSAVSDAVVELLEKLSKTVDSSSLISTSTNIGSGFITFAMSFILAIYYLMGKEKLLGAIKGLLRKIMKEETYRKCGEFCERCNRILISYITCSLLEALIVGAVNFVFMIIFGLPYAFLISCIVGITNLAPTFGPVVGCLLGMFILLLVKPGAVILFLIFTLILQTVDGYIIKPKLFGNTLGVSSLLILIFLILGGRLFGVWGILFAIPISAIMQYLVEEILFPFSWKDPFGGNDGGSSRGRLKVKAADINDADDSENGDGSEETVSSGSQHSSGMRRSSGGLHGFGSLRSLASLRNVKNSRSIGKLHGMRTLHSSEFEEEEQPKPRKRPEHIDLE